MEMKINWLEQADNRVREIFDYYKSVAGVRVAQKIVRKIYRRSEILAGNPLMGQSELLLHNRPEGFRYLVEGNYKIIYFVCVQTVNIADVFDCRRDPAKLSESVLQ